MTNTQIIRRYLAHLGIILCHLSIFGVVLLLGHFFGLLLTIMAFLMGIAIILGSVGTIFLFIPDYLARFSGFVEWMGEFASSSSVFMPVVGIVTAVCCVASIVLTAFDVRWEKARIRLFISIGMVSFVVVLLVGIIVGALGGKA